MFVQLFFILIIIFILISGIISVQWLEKNGRNKHHWFWGFASLLIVLIPAVLFPNLNVVIRWSSYSLCLYFGTIFFEQNRRRREAKKS